MFFSLSCRRSIIPSPSGRPVMSQFKEIVDDDGNSFLEIVGETNVYDKIQASEPACNVNNIVRRYQMGDVSVLQRSQGQFIDTTGMPTNLIECHRVIQNFQKQFEELPAEMRSKFNNNPFTFMQNYNEFIKTANNGNKVNNESGENHE